MPYGAFVSSGIAVPEVALEKRHRRQLRIRADRPDADELLHAAPARLLHRQRAEHDVLEEEPPGRIAVGADAADDRRQVDHDIGRELGVHALDVGLAREVVLRLARHQDRAALLRKRGRRRAGPEIRSRR